MKWQIPPAPPSELPKLCKNEIDAIAIQSRNRGSFYLLGDGLRPMFLLEWVKWQYERNGIEGPLPNL